MVPCAARAGHPLEMLLLGQLLLPLLLAACTLLRLVLCALIVLWGGSIGLRLRAVVPAGAQQCIASDRALAIEPACTWPRAQVGAVAGS